MWPDVVIVIENKEKVLQELDFMGINEKFIYGDYDSIARYIRKKVFLIRIMDVANCWPSYSVLVIDNCSKRTLMIHDCTNSIYKNV